MNKYEKEARKLCELRNLNPDESVGHAHPEGLGVMLYSPRWQLVAEEVAAWIEIQTVVRGEQ